MLISGHKVSIGKLIGAAIILFVLSSIVTYLFLGITSLMWAGYFRVENYQYPVWYGIFSSIFFIILIVAVIKGKFGIIQKM